MQRSDHSLRQMDEAYLERLEEAALRSLSSKLLLDLKEARERLNQTSRNSSLSPSREAPWERPPRAEAALEPDEDPEATGTVTEEMPGEASTDTSAVASEPAPTVAPPPMARPRAGKVKGAPGYGRPAPERVDGVESHRPEQCAGCGARLRQISHGTRTLQGSRQFALLASVIDTCRRRGHSPWEYLRTAIASRRQGLPLLPLPPVPV